MQNVAYVPQDDERCGWFHTSRQRQPKPPHSGNSHARWVIIGAGYAGLAAARQLALHYPDDEVVLLEAQEVGFGTAGRNAGFAIDLPHDIGAEDYIGDIGIARTTLRLNRLDQSILRDLVQTHGIDCQMRPSGKYQAAAAEKGIRVLEAYRRGLDKLGQEYEMIPDNQLAEHIGTSFYRQALFTPGTWLLQPAALVKGLADTLPTNVSLYENTAVTGFEYGDKVILSHRNGRITADHLLLTNNAFAMHFGFLQHTMLPVFLYASLSRPLNEDEQQRLGGKPFWGVIPADPYGSTVRRTHDNRILIRNSFTFNPNGQPKRHCLKKFLPRHQQSFRNRFPMLPDVSLEYTWSGSLALARNHEGFFGRLAPNVYAAVCCNGLGITRGTVTGTLLADWIAGKRDHAELIDFLLASPGPNKLPPEPFLSWGVQATLWWGQHKAGIEA